jgi:YfiH family protein
VLQCVPMSDVAAHAFTTTSVRLREDPAEWKRVAESVDADSASLRLLHQVHGHDVAVVRQGDPAPAHRPDADVIINSDPAVAIGVQVADCAPILLADRTRAIVGAAHAGWRGTRQNVAGTAVRSLHDTFGVDPANLIAAVGPCLGPCCGEMGLEVVEEFRAAGHSGADIDRWFTQGPRGRPLFDLWRANADQLERAGIEAASIHIARLCTKCRPDVFHSYRAGGAGVGRMAAVIRAKGPLR